MFKIWAILLVVLVLLMVTIVLSPIIVEVKLEHHGTKSAGTLSVRTLYGLVRIKRELAELHPKLSKEGPALKSVHDTTKATGKEETTLTAKEVWNFLSHWRTYSRVARRLWRPVRTFLRTIRMTKVEIKAALGTGDAVSTGCLVGTAWSGIGMLVGELSMLTRLIERPMLTVTPDFSKPRLDVAVHCIGRTKVGYAIIGVVRTLWTWVSVRELMRSLPSRSRKEEKTWNTPSRG
ncbi:DUF2953 domain-containing protein [Alicyclobacillus curvatus]|jgi:hypothetical protein|nr:DUF2953 domain-containing protein [Alicyclobacillus curvatus]